MRFLLFLLLVVVPADVQAEQACSGVDVSCTQGTPKSVTFGSRDGAEVLLDGDTLVAAGNRTSGKRSGLWFERPTRGLVEVNAYQDGKQDGAFTQFVDGRLRLAGTMRDGLEHGAVTAFDEKGRVASVHEFSNGVRHGPFREIHDNGVVKTEGTYNCGSLIDSWIKRDRNGVVVSSVDHGHPAGVPEVCAPRPSRKTTH